MADAWLAEVCRRRSSQVATLDSGFALLHADVAMLLPRRIGESPVLFESGPGD